MPMLAIDNKGNFYQTSGDRGDGLGFGSYPTPVGQTDVTLGAAYLKAQAERTRSQLFRAQAQRMQDRNDQVMAGVARDRRQMAARKEAAMASYTQHPVVQEQLLKRAIQMGCDCGAKSKANGNELTANGQFGWRGMSRDQQIIHHELTEGRMGADVSRRADPMEVRQHAINKQVENMMRAGALKLRR
jgi:hypothetical protein